MASYASDEEQIDALKRWWKENGSSLLMGVAIVFAAWFGIGQFQSSRIADAGKASELYQQLAELSLTNLSTSITEDDLLAAQTVYSELKTDYSKSIYTRYAALVMARFQVDLNHLDMAAAELQWILDNPELGFMREADPELAKVTRLRLARVKLAMGDASAALALINAEPVNEEFMAGYAEMEGDIQLNMGNLQAAQTAYEKALSALNASGTGNPVLLRLKLQGLGANLVDTF